MKKVLLLEQWRVWSFCSRRRQMRLLLLTLFNEYYNYNTVYFPCLKMGRGMSSPSDWIIFASKCILEVVWNWFDVIDLYVEHTRYLANNAMLIHHALLLNRLFLSSRNKMVQCPIFPCNFLTPAYLPIYSRCHKSFLLAIHFSSPS